MSDKPETLADICARIRKIDESMMRDIDFMAVFLEFLPRDIEAAAEREREINQKILAAANDANAILKDDRDRAIQFANAAPHPGSVSWKEMHEVYAKARAIPSAVPKEGSAAAMREALVEILDRTNREKARDYDAALNGGILEIHDIANTALNQERSADALEKARAPGNTAKMREAILAIKEINDRRPHDADGYEINDIIEEALAGNAETKKEAADVCE